MSTHTNGEQDRQFAQIVLNDHRLEELDRFVHEDFVEDNPPPGQGPGRDGLRDFLTAFLTAFPDLTWTVKDLVADGDTVAAWSVWEGTHRGEYQGIAPTGRRVSVEAWTFDKFRDGRMASSRILMDVFGLLQQLGAVPAQ
jgi:steroid delta-isomerase-like uncharacterized protein